MSQVVGVFANEARAVWPTISHHIEKALAVVDTGYLLEDLLDAIEQRDKQLWVIDGGAAAGITSIHVLPQWKKLVVEYLGGECMDAWEDAWFSTMQQFAKANECRFIEAQGRPGWARLARRRNDVVETIQLSRKTV